MPTDSTARPDDLFGTDGVRGVSGTEITPELARRVARAFAALLRERADRPTVMLARDTRVSGPELGSAFSEELCGHGVSVIDCGVLPTGALCLLAGRDGVAGGAIISASHNPPQFNGIKLVGRGGHKLPAEQQQALERLIRADPGPAQVADDGQCRVHPDPASAYHPIVSDGFAPNCLQGLTVVLDCAHGSASEFAPRAFEDAGARVHAIHCDADGGRINLDCGSTVPERVAREVIDRGADLGAAFDGDADRVVFADHRGRVVDGDGTKYVLAMDRLRRGLLEPPVVVGTVMNNFGLERALAQHNVTLERTPVGDRHVLRVMRETGAWLGGEQSGHIIFRETLIGDGIYTALRLCEVVARTRQSLAELAAPVEKIPQHLVNLHAEDKEAWRGSEQVRNEIARWERRLEGSGRVLVRASGTEPLVRVMVEAEDPELAQQAVDAIGEAVRAVCDGEATG
jgi:phosphoglucosamine mutase